MLKIVIAEDNKYERIILKKQLSRIPEVQVEGEAETGSKLIEIVESIRPDIVFLDIDLPDMSGIKAAEEIADIYPNLFIIFATAYEGFTREAFDVYAFDYLVKPYDLERISRTLEKIRSIKEGKPNQSAASAAEVEETEAAVQLAAGKPGSLFIYEREPKLVIQSSESIVFIKNSDICFITRSARKTEVFTKSGIFKTNDPLEKLEGKLSEGFFRSHKGYIINADQVSEILPWGNRTYMVKFYETKDTALITLDKFKQFKAKYFLE